MKFSAGVTTLMAAATVGGAFAFAPSKVNGVSSPLKSTAEGTETYTFTKSEEIFAEAVEVRNQDCPLNWSRLQIPLPLLSVNLENCIEIHRNNNFILVEEINFIWIDACFPCLGRQKFSLQFEKQIAYNLFFFRQTLPLSRTNS